MIAPGRSKPGKGLQKDLHDAIRLCSYNDLRRAIQNGADVNSGDYLDKSDFYPLLQACADSKGLWIVRLLIEHGARVDVRNTSEATPLHIACFNGRVDSVRLLIEYGADVNAKNDAGNNTGGFTPLHLACRYGRADTAKFLLENGADPALVTENGDTAIEYALELEKADPCREKILSLFQQFAPELYFSTFCTAPVNSGGM